ncbi:MAG: type II toxin-antitoxin system RelE/ParE family toxin [Candidatus Sungbacteria bacterium]|nr:type II toxin-antitoxin system RelE/ParE family toxin [Candidatus Sungbacteria bacterium]
MNWHLYIRGKAKKQFKKVPKDYSEHILRAIDEIGVDPHDGDVQKMAGDDRVWRKRIGSYRIKFEIYEERMVIYIFEIKRRTSSTY